MKTSARKLVTVTIGAAMAVGAVLLTGGPASADTAEAQAATSAEGLISGPLIDGPLVDLGDLPGIGDIQFGQFQ